MSSLVFWLVFFKLTERPSEGELCCICSGVQRQMSTKPKKNPWYVWFCLMCFFPAFLRGLFGIMFYFLGASLANPSKRGFQITRVRGRKVQPNVQEHLNLATKHFPCQRTENYHLNQFRVGIPAQNPKQLPVLL